MFARLLKDVIKDEVIYRVKSRKVLSTEASFCPRGVGVCDHPGVHMFNGKQSELCTSGGFMEASLCRHDRSLTAFSALLTSQENGGGVRL